MPRAALGPGFDHTNVNGGVNRWGADLPWRTYVAIINKTLEGWSAARIAADSAIQVHVSTVYRVRERFLGNTPGHAAGDFMTKQRGGRGSAPPKLQLPQLLYLRFLYNTHSDMYLYEYKQRLAADIGVNVSEAAICRALKFLKLTRKVRALRRSTRAACCADARHAPGRAAEGEDAPQQAHDAQPGAHGAVPGVASGVQQAHAGLHR